VELRLQACLALAQRGRGLLDRIPAHLQDLVGALRLVQAVTRLVDGFPPAVVALAGEAESFLRLGDALLRRFGPFPGFLELHADFVELGRAAAGQAAR